jgi:hypothetical protein
MTLMAVNDQSRITPAIRVIATDSQAIYRRFGTVLPRLIRESRLDMLLASPLDAAADPIWTELQQTGLLHVRQGQLQPALPVAERLAEEIRLPLTAALAPCLPRLRRLAQRLPQVAGPAWEALGHSLLGGYLLWGVGAHLLLDFAAVESMVCLVADPAQLAGIWLETVSVRPDLALTQLVGATYPDSTYVQALLATDGLRRTLASLDEAGTLVVQGAETNSLMTRLSGLRVAGRDRDGVIHSLLDWPQLDEAQVQGVRQPLSRLASGLWLTIQDVMPKVPTAGYGADGLLVAYSLLVAALIEDWIASGILPVPPTPELGEFSPQRRVRR